MCYRRKTALASDTLTPTTESTVLSCLLSAVGLVTLRKDTKQGTFLTKAGTITLFNGVTWLHENVQLFILFYFSLQFFSTSSSLVGYSSRRSWVRHSSRKSSATHSYQCVQYFRVSAAMVRLPVFGIFNLHTDLNACDCTRGLYGHLKRVCTESWFWKKIPCRTGDSNPRQYYTWLFSRTLYPVRYSRPNWQSHIKTQQNTRKQAAGAHWMNEWIKIDIQRTKKLKKVHIKPCVFTAPDTHSAYMYALTS